MQGQTPIDPETVLRQWRTSILNGFFLWRWRRCQR